VKVKTLLRPDLAKLSVLVILASLSLLVVAGREATSKVTWRENRGAPLAFVTLTRYRGPCGPEFKVCEKLHVEAWHPLPFLMNSLVLYLISCVIGSTSYVRRRPVSEPGRTEQP
jgi:hypothetical protein